MKTISHWGEPMPITSKDIVRIIELYTFIVNDGGDEPYIGNAEEVAVKILVAMQNREAAESIIDRRKKQAMAYRNWATGEMMYALGDGVWRKCRRSA